MLNSISVKKILFSAFIIIAASNILLAQVTFGPKLGGSRSLIKYIKKPVAAYNYMPILTPQIGIIVDIQLGNLFALRPELLYLQRAGEVRFSSFFENTAYTEKITSRLSYIEVPLNAILGRQLGTGRLEVFAGPAFGLGLGGRLTEEIDDNTGKYIAIRPIHMKKNPDDPKNYDEYRNAFNVSLNFGVDYKFDNGILIQAGYNLGLTNLNPHHTVAARESARNDYVLKASSFNLGLGLLFGKKK